MNINEEKERLAKEAVNKLESENPNINSNPTSLGNIKDISPLSIHNEEFSDTPNLEMGWKRLVVENLPSRGMFYPIGTTIDIKAATASEIRHFSTIDEDDPFDLPEKLNMILDKCVKIKWPGGLGVNFRDIKDIDRFYLIFCIRELTFKDGENKLFMDIQDPQTGDFEKVEITKDKFEFNTIDDKIMEYYSLSERCFVFRTTVGEINIYIPSLGISNFIINHLRDMTAKKIYYDKAFLKISPYVFSNWRTLNKDSYKKMEKESLAWEPKKISIINGVIEKLQFGMSSEIKHTFKSGSEVSSPITFQGGYKSLFLISDIFGELL